MSGCTVYAVIVTILAAAALITLYQYHQKSTYLWDNWSINDRFALKALILKSKVLEKECRADRVDKLAACIVGDIAANVPSFAAWKNQQGQSPIIMPILGTRMDTLARCKAKSCV
jgi:hypothetical protein